MSSSAANRREKLARPALLLLLIGVVGGVLVAVFPRDGIVPSRRGQIDAVTLAYSRVLLRASPRNAELRLSLAEAELSVGRLDAAARTLEPLLTGEGGAARRARQILLEIDLTRWRALPADSAERHSERNALAERIARAFAEAEETAVGQGLAEVALELGHPELAAELYLALAERHRGDVRLGELHQGCAASRPWLENLSGAACFALLALEASLAADDPQRSAELAARAGTLFPLAPRVVERAMAVALAGGRSREARRWGRVLLVTDPAGMEVPRRLLELALQEGDLDEALDLARGLVARLPEDVHARRRLAEAAEWSGRTGEAYDAWLWLLARGVPDAAPRALALARELNDLKTVAKLLLGRESESLRDLSILAEALEATADPLAAARLLSPRFLARADRLSLDRLVGLLSRAGEHGAALALEEAIEARFGETLEGRLRQAQRLVTLWRAPEALERLLSSSHLARAEHPGFWQQVGDLAWNEERNAEAFDAYSALWRRGALSLDRELRLISLTWEAQRLEDLEQLAIGVLERDGDPRPLLLALDLSLREENWDALRRLLERGRPAHDTLAAHVLYWRAQAELARAEGDQSRALAALERAQRLEPGAGTEATLLWLALDLDDTDALERCLRRFLPGAERDPALWRPLALALSRLGRPQEAVAWFDRVARLDPGDSAWLLAYAHVLEQSGRAVAAERLRRAAFAAPQGGALASLAWAPVMRHHFGWAPAERWALGRLALSPAAPDAAGLAGWLVAAGRLDTAREVERLQNRSLLDDSQRLQVELTLGNGERVDDLLSGRPTLTVRDRLEAERTRGHREIALGLAREALAEETQEEARQSLRALADGLAAPLADTVAVRVDNQSTALLDTLRAEAGARVSTERVALGARASLLRWTGPLAGTFVDESSAELEGVLRHRTGETEAAVTVRLRDDGALPGLRLRHHDTPARGLSWSASAHLREMIEESPVLRLHARRDRLALSGTAEPFSRLALSGQLEAMGYALRGGDPVGLEAVLRLSAAQAIALGEQQLVARADVSLGGSRFAEIPGLLPPAFALAGAGLALTTDAPLARLRPFGELWGGQEWPTGRAVYRIRAGLGVEVFHGDLLTVDWHVANDQSRQAGVPAGGFGIGFSHRLDRWNRP